MTAGAYHLVKEELRKLRNMRIDLRSSLSVVTIALASFFVINAQTPAPVATPAEVKVDAKALDSYVGQYADPANLPGLVLSFFREGDKFYVRATNQDQFEMYASSPTLFIVRAFAASAEFVKDDAGRITAMIWRQGGGETKVKRTADFPEPDKRVPYKRTEALIPMRDGVKLF